MKIRLWVSTVVSFCVLLSASGSFAGLLDNFARGVNKGTGGGISTDTGLRSDIDRCDKENDEFNNNVEYTTANGGPDKIIAKLGKPEKIIRNDPNYFLARWPLKNAKSDGVTIEIGCVPSRCELHCLAEAKVDRGKYDEACREDVRPFDDNIDCNVDNCPDKLQEKFGKAKFSRNDPGTGKGAGGEIKYKDGFKDGSSIKTVMIYFSCDKKTCDVGCTLR